MGYIEAKNIDANLENKDFQIQFQRYRQALNNIIFTDYLEFHLYTENTFIQSVRIGEVGAGKLKALPENFQIFEDLIKLFGNYLGQTIRTPEHLAEMMANKARMLASAIEKVLIIKEKKWK